MAQDTERFSPRALVLDMDGLMVDSEPLWFQVERAFAAARGGAWTHELTGPCVGRGMAYTLRTMGERFGFAVDVARDTAELMDRFVARLGDLTLKPGCAELIDAAGGRIPLAVASSSPRRLIEAVLARFDLASRFHAVVSGEEVDRPKPAPDIFLHAARALGVTPAACAVFEDSVPGATAGRAAGMFVIAVPDANADGEGQKRVLDALTAVADRVVPDLFAARGAIVLPEGAW
jgi:mannitol-1-/sugar-/sorbitol-6-/2-deoxyglucose-6-phosphatase